MLPLARSRTALPLLRQAALRSATRPACRLPIPLLRRQCYSEKKTPEGETEPPDTLKTDKTDKKTEETHTQTQPDKQTDTHTPNADFPLPDLTKGLPSTIFSELEHAKRSKSSRPALPNLTEGDDPDFAAAAAAASAGGSRGSGKGDGPEYVSSTDRRRDKMASISYAFFWTSAFAGALYLGRNWADDEEEKAHPDAPSGWSPLHWWNRVKARYTDITSYYADPPFPKLLPDEDPALRQPYTLVLSLEDLLVHNEWSREHGWRLAKRPGVDYFLRYLNQYFELVLFTSVPVMQADQVLRKLDPFRIIRWPLGREAARYEKGEYIKDLSYLNRDLSKVLIIDTSPAHVKAQPENAIILPKWTGDPHDKDLVALIPFLEYIAGVGIEDVRTVLASFKGTHIPTEFLRREKIMREKHAERVAEESKTKPKRSVGSLASLLGMKPQSAVDGASADEGKMILDLIRERGQKNYEFMDREIRENGPKWLAEMEAEEEKMKQMQMASMKQGFFGSLGLGGKQEEPQEKEEKKN